MPSFPFSFPGGLGAGTPLPTRFEAVDHEAAALDRLAQHLRDQPRVEGLVRLVGTRTEEVEAALLSLETERLLETATGDQLDVFGDLVGQARAEADDATYRLRIKARVRVNRSNGRGDELLAIFRLVVPAGATLRLSEYEPTTIVLRVETYAIADELRDVLLVFMRKAKAAGVRAVMHWSESPSSATFRFDSGPGLDVGHLAGASL